MLGETAIRHLGILIPANYQPKPGVKYSRNVPRTDLGSVTEFLTDNYLNPNAPLKPLFLL